VRSDCSIAAARALVLVVEDLISVEAIDLGSIVSLYRTLRSPFPYHYAVILPAAQATKGLILMPKVTWERS
jgi:hypothetical protein